jgi:dTDP-4-dehydrorhamnose reductase
MKERVLVIGSSGQVGNQIAAILGDTALHSGRSPHGETAERRNWVYADLVEFARNPELAQKLVNSSDITALYCVAGATDVERCEQEPEWAMDSNCGGPLALAKAALHIPFIYFSTEYVFSGDEGPYDEDAPTHALSAYGRSKSRGEQEILEAHPSPLIVRTTVVYGNDPAHKNFLYSLRRQLGSGKQMRVAVDQISTPTYNLDLAAATVSLVNAGHTGIFHVCGDELLSRYDFALMAAQRLKLDTSHLSGVLTSELNQRAPRPLSAGLKTDKLKQTLPTFRMRSNMEALDDWIEREWPQHLEHSGGTEG